MFQSATDPNAKINDINFYFSGGVTSLFYQLGVVPPSREDNFNISYNSDIVSVRIARRGTGVVENVRFYRSGDQFEKFIIFNPKSMPRSERDRLIRKLHANNLPQKQIADLMGLTQQAVSYVCKKDLSLSVKNACSQNGAL
ncbi:hypothetical protein [Uliginosibacterium sediminicola]|uniref:Uncharacterized protein n=1 Tax=Uliginosibacterium sediminicola TaxID=2024550 RepID=A0ABU9YZT6_9RHOO